MTFKSYLLSISFVFPFLFFWQNDIPPKLETPYSDTSVFFDSTHYCAQQEIHENLWQQQPDKLTRHEDFEKRLLEFLKKNEGTIGAEKADFTIPTVVHIIHNNGPENISDATVLQGMQHLNDAYENVGYYDQGTGVNTEFAFCLARRDPDGNATTGITRDVSPLTDMILEDDDITVKDLNRWDPTQYLNIWLVASITSNAAGPGVAGYAYFPASHGAPEDGIMMEAEWFGSDPGSSSVITHEAGHYLGLYHTFQDGCPNNDCMMDGDRVCDTPPDNSTAAVPCNGTANSCMTDTDSGFPTDQNDMFWNYMDYGDWDCYSAFTQGQTDRMTFVIENDRSSLLDSKGCIDPCTSPLTSSFTASATTLDVGGTVNFLNNSTNYNNAVWTVDGTVFSNNTNADYTFNQVGFFKICLEVLNADPNCSDEFCLTIETTCPVDAEFITDNFYPAPGQPINYTNQSQNASGYEWQVNGTTEGTGIDFSWAFQNEGIYDVCLIANNGLCENEFCLPVFVEEPEEECENSTFIRIFGEANIEERGFSILPSNDGNLYLTGSSGNSSLIIKMDISGIPIWQREFNFSNFRDVLAEIFVDSDNNIVGCGFGESGNNTDNVAFMFKYDPVGDNMIWSRQFSAYSRSFGILEPQSGGDYLAYMSDNGNLGQDALFVYLDRNDGTETGQLFNKYDLGSSETFTSVVSFNNELYATGRYTNGAGFANMRLSVSKFDLNGNEQWSNLSFVPLNNTARLYGRDMIEDGGDLYSVGSGDDDGTSATQTHVFLQKNTINGNIDWVRKYDVTQFSNEWSEEIVSTTDGFLLYGVERQSPGDLFLLKTDKDGNFLWAKSYGGSGQEEVSFTTQSQIFAAGDFIYFTAITESYGGDKDIMLIKTDSGGNIDDECIEVQELDVTVTTVPNPSNASVTLSVTPSPLTQSAPSVTPENISVAYEDALGCECEDQIECDTTFLKTYGSINEDEFGFALTDAPGGGFFLGGGKGNEAMISKLNEEGDLEWTRKFDPTGDASDFIWELKLDSEDNLIGIGQSDEANGNIEAFAFRYDWQNDNFLWLNEINVFDPAIEGYYTIIEKSPGGNFNVFGQVGQLNVNAAFAMEVNRNSGIIIWSREYSVSDVELFHQTVQHNGSYYSTGHYLTAGNQLRPGITRKDLNGNEIWTKLHLVPTSTNNPTNLTGKDIIADNGLVVFGNGNSTGGNASTDIFLYRTNDSGELDWEKSFDIPIANTMESAQLLNLPDGYLCLGYYTIPNGGSDIFLFKTNKQGVLEWARSYDGVYTDEVDEAYDMIYQSGQIFFTGKTTNGNDEDVFLARLGVDGNPTAQDSCNFFSELEIVETNWSEMFSEQIDLNESGSSTDIFVVNEVTESFDLEESILCFAACNDSCEFRPDAQFILADAFCMGDSMLIELEVCNIGNFTLPLNTPIVFYDDDPTSVPANILHIDSISQKIKRDSCFSFEILMPSVTNQEIFVLLNDNGTTAVPFNLSSEDDFPNSGITECDFTNNIGSFEINFSPPPLDLGPDIIVCENGVVPLDAGPGFYRYRWQDGDDEQTYTAFFPGTYSVEVTDSCGGIQTDEITITVDPATILDIGNDTLICEGDSLIISPTGFDRYEWFPKNVFPCDTCSTVEIFPTANDTMEVIVVGTTDLGCISVDTILIGTTLPVFSFDTVSFCPGDSVIIFGEVITEPGIYSNVFPSAEGCDSTHTVTLEAIANLLLVLPDDISIELGDSIRLNPVTNGQNLTWEWTPDYNLSCNDCERPYARPFETTLYTLLITDENGCDVSDDILLSIIKNRGIYIPNAFSPNSDGINDVFHTYSRPNVSQILDFKVFDRWGGLVFEDGNFSPNDPAHGWDGTFKGKMMNPAVFAYMAKVEFVDGHVELFSGDVTLIR